MRYPYRRKVGLLGRLSLGKGAPSRAGNVRGEGMGGDMRRGVVHIKRGAVTEGREVESKVK